MTRVDQLEVREKLLQLGVDEEILDEIDSLPQKEKDGMYTAFIEIMSDELLFVLAMRKPNFVKEYMVRKRQGYQVGLN